MARLAVASGAELHYESVGAGRPVLAVHGAYSAHQEVRAFLDGPLADCRRIYPDLPGMGGSTATGVRDANDAVAALEELVEAEIGDSPFAVVGHSLGALVAQGLAARRPAQVRGLALLCPYPPPAEGGEPSAVVVDDGAAASILVEGELEEFRGYFVVQTAATARRFQQAVVPTLGRYDGEVVERLLATHRPDPAPVPGAYAHPVLVMTGRQDSIVGWRQQDELLATYPGATAMVVARAGHALPHEHPELVGAALRHWLAQVDVGA